ncbi:MAG: hypothetical protein MUF87_17135 [Anaerolineae bacterium]|jgi:hypothetical protein|nr:hypothetical protein [Anaerolineae bacterium]
MSVFPQPEEEHSLEALRRLRRLQEHSRGNLAALLAQRAHAFTLSEEPPSPEANTRVQVMVYPQDPFVGEPEIRRIDAHDIRPGLINTRVQISAAAPAQPDEDGNYLYPPATPEFDQISAFYYTTYTLRMYERYAARAIPWAFPSPRITVDAHVGNLANAFYNEADRLVGFHTYSAPNGQRISTAQSADIVSHEAGHAILDGLRDLYNESFGLGSSGFHESFGDMTAILVALHDDSLNRRLLRWSNNNLNLENFVTRIAEQLTEALMQDSGAVTPGSTVYLRNAFNTLTLKPFDTLLYTPPDPLFTLGRQAHNYSRVFTGAFYDVLVGVYDHLRAEGHQPHIALVKARDLLGYLLIAGVECAPVGEFSFYDMALAWIGADHLMYDGRYRQILIDVFTRREFAPRQAFMDFVAKLDTLPDLRLPQTLNNALAAAIYLQETILPTLQLTPEQELIPLATYRNSDGCAYLTFFSSESITLQGTEYGAYSGTNLELFGGLTLAFDWDNRLRSVIYRPVTAEDHRQIRVIVRDLIEQGQITSVGATAFRERPPAGFVLPDQGKLIKNPARVDLIREIMDFVEYMQQLKTHVRLNDDE